jgi:hypothetical protein
MLRRLREDDQNLERLKEQVAVEVECSDNQLERTRSIVNVAVQVAKRCEIFARRWPSSDVP